MAVPIDPGYVDVWTGIRLSEFTPLHANSRGVVHSLSRIGSTKLTIASGGPGFS
jgi:hypothetical protein